MQDRIVLFVASKAVVGVNLTTTAAPSQHLARFRSAKQVRRCLQPATSLLFRRKVALFCIQSAWIGRRCNMPPLPSSGTLACSHAHRVFANVERSSRWSYRRRQFVSTHNLNRECHKVGHSVWQSGNDEGKQIDNPLDPCALVARCGQRNTCRSAWRKAYAWT